MKTDQSRKQTNQEKIGEICQSNFENKIFIQAVRSKEDV